jgi:hypothetical protein
MLSDKNITYLLIIIIYDKDMKNKDGFVLPELLRVIYESAKRAS